MKQKNKNRVHQQWGCMIIGLMLLFVCSVIGAFSAGIHRYHEYNRICENRLRLVDISSSGNEKIALKVEKFQQNFVAGEYMGTLALNTPVAYSKIHFSPDSEKILITGVPSYRYVKLIWKPYVQPGCYLHISANYGISGFSANSEIIVFRNFGYDEAFDVRNGWSVGTSGLDESSIIPPVETDEDLLNRIASYYELEESEGITDAKISPDGELLAVARYRVYDIYPVGYVDLWRIPTSDTTE